MVVLADDREVLYSLDWGETWTSAGEILPQQEPQDARITALHVTPDRHVVAGTNGRSVYIGEFRSTSPTAPEEEPLRATTLAAWPNPTSTTLTVFTPSGTERLDVLDVLGRVVLSVPVSGSGKEHRLEVGVSALPAGVYFIRAGYDVVPVTVAR
jgi:hypothetical protein